TATYQWDNEGRMTSLQYPTVSATGSFGNMPAVMPIAGYQYDSNGHLSGMTMDDQDGYGPQPYASATYTPAGQLSTLSDGIGTETRQYNSLMQLTSQSGPLSMTYTYAAGQNNGRIINSQDGTTGENTNYTYDALNRLTTASNSQWSEQYTYDGFGNLTSKTGSGGSPNPAPSMSTTYNANNQATGQGQGYDGNGNLTYGGFYSWYSGYNTSYTYSIENRLQSETPFGGSTTIYAYDPLGKRVMSESDP